MLAGVGAILRESLQPGDRVVRWGGDEFVIVRIDTDLDEAAALAERIRATSRSAISLARMVGGTHELLDWLCAVSVRAGRARPFPGSRC